MKAILPALFVIIIPILSIAQTGYPAGSYMSLDELLIKKPSAQHNLRIKASSKAGGNYKVTPSDKSIKKKMVLKEIAAVSDGKELYINSHKLGYTTFFNLVESEGRYLSFLAGVTSNEMATAQLAGGLIAASATASVRHLYVLDTSTGLIQKVDRKVMSKLLEPFPDIQAKFEADKSKKLKDLLREYIKLLNEKNVNLQEPAISD